MSIIDIYDLIFNFQIKSSFAAFLRVLTCGFVLSFVAWHIKDIVFCCHPKKIFSYTNYIKFCENLYPQISLFNIKTLGQSVIFLNIIFGLFFISGLCSIFGLLTNLSILIFLITFISIQSRAFPVFFSGGDVVSRILLLSLFLTDCGSRYSIDNLLHWSTNLDLIDGWAIRIVQGTILGGYFVSGINKINKNCWADGLALLYSIFSGLWGRRLNLEILKYDIIHKSLSFGSLFIEIVNPILFLFKETQNIALLIAASLHLGIIIFMRLGFFGPIMLVGLSFFCNRFF